MKGFTSIFAALCLTAYTNASPALPLFSFVKFANDPCNTGNNNRMGTCYTKDECENLNGKAGDMCAEGFGVCCEFSEVECSDTISQNNTFLIKDSFTASSSCTYKVCPLSENICRIKFQFDTLVLSDPVAGSAAGTATAANNENSVGSCGTDQFFISGGNGSPIICGTNSGQHMIMDSDGSASSCNTINIHTGTGSTNAKWSIHVTQHDCIDMTALENTAGPKGCLQYFLGDANNDGAGRIDNFGFPGTAASSDTPVIPATATHLQNQNYNICIRRHAKMNTICYTVVAKGPAGTDQTGFGLSLNLATADDAKAQIDAGCSLDWISIPNGAVASGIAAFKFCGSFFNNIADETADVVVCSSQQPFIIGVNTDGSEAADETANAPAGTVGFHLKFAQSTV